MATIHQKEPDNKNTIGAVVAGVAGAVAVAGVAVATTMALKDEKTRKKVKNVLIKAKDQAIDYVDTFRTESNAKKGTNKIKEIAINLKKVVEK